MENLSYLIVIVICLLQIQYELIFCYEYRVSISKNWPVPLGDIMDFTIEQNFNLNSELLIEVMNSHSSNKWLKIDKKYYVEQSTPYFKISKTIKKVNWSKFTVSFNFTEKCHNKLLIFRWFVDGVDKLKPELVNNPANIIYKSQVVLSKSWQLTMTKEVQENINSNDPIWRREERYFLVDRRAKISCVAADGLPKSSINLLWSKPPLTNHIQREDNRGFDRSAYDEKLNNFVGYFQLRKSDHNRNVSCIVTNTQQTHTITIKVNHKPSSLILNPEYNGYLSNGTEVSCRTSDGYPKPTIKWTFIHALNHSSPSSLYTIRDSILNISHLAPKHVILVFNCTAYYTDPLTTETSTIHQHYEFIIGEKPDILVINPIILDNKTDYNSTRSQLNKAVIGASVAGVIILIIAVAIVVMLCYSKPRSSRQSSSMTHDDSPKYAGSILAASKSTLKTHAKAHNGRESSRHLLNSTGDTTTGGVGGVPGNPPANNSSTDYNYDDMPRSGRKPIKVVDDPVVYSTIIGTMQQKARPSLDIGPIDRV